MANQGQHSKYDGYFPYNLAEANCVLEACRKELFLDSTIPKLRDIVDQLLGVLQYFKENEHVDLENIGLLLLAYAYIRLEAALRKDLVAGRRFQENRTVYLPCARACLDLVKKSCNSNIEEELGLLYLVCVGMEKTFAPCPIPKAQLPQFVLENLGQSVPSKRNSTEPKKSTPPSTNPYRRVIRPRRK